MGSGPILPLDNVLLIIKGTGTFVVVLGKSVAFAQIKPAKINLSLFGRF